MHTALFLVPIYDHSINSEYWLKKLYRWIWMLIFIYITATFWSLFNRFYWIIPIDVIKKKSQCQNNSKIKYEDRRKRHTWDPIHTCTWSHTFLTWYRHYNKQSGGVKLVSWTTLLVKWCGHWCAFHMSVNWQSSHVTRWTALS